MKKSIPLLLAAMILWPGQAHALTMEYITYGSIDAVHAAFWQVSQIFRDPGYLGLIAVCAVVGIIGGGFAALSGVITNPAVQGFTLKWAGAAMLGVVVYLALFQPTGHLVFYDKTYNRHTSSAAPGSHMNVELPLAVVLIAGITNKIEVGIIQIIEDAGFVQPGLRYSEAAGGIGFDVLAKMTNTAISDPGLTPSFNRYMSDCMTFEIMRPGTSLSWDDLQDGRISVTNALSEGANPAIYTVHYALGESSRGETVTCQAAWQLLEPMLTAAVSWDKAMEAACMSAGYRFSSANHPTTGIFSGGSGEKTQCYSLVEEIFSSHFGVNKSAPELMKSQQLMKLIGSHHLFGSPEVAAVQRGSQQIAATGITSGLVAAEWMPVMRGVMIAVAVGLLPLMVLFIPTPLFTRGLSVMVGFFVFLSTWGIADALLHSMAINHSIGEAASLVSDSGAEDMGMRTALLFPDHATKVAASFGKIRGAGMMLAAAMTMMLVRFGGHALTAMSSQLAGAVGQGAALGGQIMTPHGQVAAANEQAQAAAKAQAWGEVGRAGGGNPLNTQIRAGAHQELRGWGSALANKEMMHHEQAKGNIGQGNVSMAGGRAEAAAGMRFADAQGNVRTGGFDSTGNRQGAQDFRGSVDPRTGAVKSGSEAHTGHARQELTSVSGRSKITATTGQDGNWGAEIMSVENKDIQAAAASVTAQRHIDGVARDWGVSQSWNMTDQQLAQAGLTRGDQETFTQSLSQNRAHEWQKTVGDSSQFGMDRASSAAESLKGMAHAGLSVNKIVSAGGQVQYEVSGQSQAGNRVSFSASEQEGESIKRMIQHTEQAAVTSTFSTDQGLRYASGYARATGANHAAKELEQAQTINEDRNTVGANILTSAVNNAAGGRLDRAQDAVVDLEKMHASGDMSGIRNFFHHHYDPPAGAATQNVGRVREEVKQEVGVVGRPIIQGANSAAENAQRETVTAKAPPPIDKRGLEPGKEGELERRWVATEDRASGRLQDHSNDHEGEGRVSTRPPRPLSNRPGKSSSGPVDDGLASSRTGHKR